MIDKEKVEKLAKLARIELMPEEADGLSRELGSVLDYVGEIKSAQLNDSRQPTTNDYPVKNIMREDVSPHEGGAYTKEILDQAPEREGDYIKVKKIL